MPLCLPRGFPDALVSRGEIAMTKIPGGFRVDKADERAEISLAVLARACEHELTVHPSPGGDLITIADQVVYRVVGYANSALQVELVGDHREAGT